MCLVQRLRPRSAPHAARVPGQTEGTEVAGGVAARPAHSAGAAGGAAKRTEGIEKIAGAIERAVRRTVSGEAMVGAVAGGVAGGAVEGAGIVRMTGLTEDSHYLLGQTRRFSIHLMAL